MDNVTPQSTTPNLFIVGAPKCGTTSLYEYLRRHPQVYFPHAEEDYARIKEPNHLCPELDIAETDAIRDRDAYLALYRDGAHARWRGDASTNYLYSPCAADNIKQLSPDARILIMLRPPVAWMRSYHSELVRHHHEDILDFEQAVAASAERRNGERIPARTGVPGCLDYVSMARFAPQVQRYLDVFGPAAVKVLLLEDLARSPTATFRGVLQFLGLDTGFQPDFMIYNETPRQGAGERILRSIYRNPAVKATVQHLLPRRARRTVLQLVRRREAGRAGSDAGDAHLHQACAADIDELAQLIGRDLDDWKPHRQERRRA